jgi:RNA polymerase sigma-70 factor (ECF subfamily)
MERDAFEQVVLEQKDRLFGYATMMLRDPAEAQDVAQETLVRLWQNRQQVDGAGARAWLKRTAHNLCIDRLRRRRTRSEIDGDVDRETRPDGEPGPQRLAASAELGRHIERCLGQLGEADRAVLVLRDVEGLPYDEVARVLDLPLGTLKARLHRARHNLRARLIRAGVTP